MAARNSVLECWLGASRYRVWAKALVLGCWATAASAQSDGSCPTVRPVVRIEGLEIYGDAAGSISDPERERRNAEMRAGLTAYLRLLHETYDPSSTHGLGKHCADIAIAQWVAANALLTRPTSSTPRVERVLAAVALNALFLKRSQAGHPSSVEERAWLRDLTAAVAQDYNRDSMANTQFYRNNVYFWSMAAQGLHAVLTHAPIFVARSEQGWQDAMRRIDADGYIEPELKRGRRALIYHQFAYSALLILRQTRYTLGLPVSAADQAAMKRLSDAIGRALCDPSDMARRAHVPDQEQPGAWGFRVPPVFGADLNGETWQRCGIKPPPVVVDLRIGGNIAATKRALERAAR